MCFVGDHILSLPKFMQQRKKFQSHVVLKKGFKNGGFGTYQVCRVLQPWGWGVLVIPIHLGYIQAFDSRLQ